MELDPLRVRSAGPVPDAPVHALTSHADGLAKGWLLALLERRSLAAIAGAPTEELANEGPALCSSAARALASDEELAALAADAPAVLRRLTGGHGVGMVEVVEVLRAIVWAAILEILPEPRPGQLADLADRLAHVTAELLKGALAAEADQAPLVQPTARVPPPMPRASERSEPEFAASPPEPAALASEPSPSPQERDAQTPGRLTPLPPEGGRSLWDRALERRLDEGLRLAERTALLLLEVDGVGRLRTAGELDGALERGAAAIREEVRRGDLVAHEEDGRTWVLAGDMGRPAAEALARRIAARMAGVPGPRGSPLTASVGLAVHPEDGGDTGLLSAHAEEAMLAARAAGVRLLADAPV